MKTELTRDDLLNNISTTLGKLQEVKGIEDQIAELYKEPVTDIQKKMMATLVNLAWMTVFATMAFNFPGYHLLIMPVLYWIFRGSKVSERVSRSIYKNQLDSNEKKIDQLYQLKGEREYELKTVSMLEKELHDVVMLKQFESYLQSKQAITIDKCMELYKNEKKKKVQ